MWPHDVELTECEFLRNPCKSLKAKRFCSFGITESLAALAATALTSAGVGTATAGILGTGLTDAAIGAGTSALTGGNPLIGAATGGLGGLGGGLAGNLGLGTALGIGNTAADTLGGAVGGTLGSALTGGNLLTGALGGGALGYGIGSNGIPGTTPGATPSAAAGAAPSTGLGGAGAGGSVGAITAPNINPNIGNINASLPDLTASIGAPGAGGGGGLGGAASSGGNIAGSASGGLPDLSSSIGAGSAPAGTVAAPSVSPNIGNVSGAAPSLPSAGGGGISGGLNNIGSSLAAGIEKNPLQALSSGLGIVQSEQAQNALNNTIKGVSSQIAGQNAGATSLESALTTGQLPPGAQAAVNQATQSAQAAIRGKYAQLGLTGSTMEQQELNNVTQQAAGQVFQLADQLYGQGLSQTGLSNQLYSSILQAQGQQAGVTRNSLTNYASALGSGSSTATPSTTA